MSPTACFWIWPPRSCVMPRRATLRLATSAKAFDQPPELPSEKPGPCTVASSSSRTKSLLRPPTGPDSDADVTDSLAPPLSSNSSLAFSGMEDSFWLVGRAVEEATPPSPISARDRAELDLKARNCRADH